jgi:hypothetical protein
MVLQMLVALAWGGFGFLLIQPSNQLCGVNPLHQLLTDSNAHGTITNSDLELAAQIAEQDILVQIRSCQESTISTFTNNISARAWQRKGSKSTLGPVAYLLRLHSLHQQHYRYYPTIDYLPGPINTMADDASRLWHLSDSALLLHFNSLYKQPQPWKLLTLRPTMNSALTMSLLCKRSKPELFLHAPVLEMRNFRLLHNHDIPAAAVPLLALVDPTL